MDLKTIVSALLASLAADLALADNQSLLGKITRIYPFNGNVFFRLDIQGSCPSLASNHNFYISNKNEDFDVNYALLLASSYQGKNIYVNADNAACSDAGIASTKVRYLVQGF